MGTYKSRNDVPDDKIELVNKEDLRKLAIGLKKTIYHTVNRRLNNLWMIILPKSN